MGIKHNNQIPINQASAKWFFEKSKLFKATGLDFGKVVEEYKKNTTGKQNER